MSDAKNSGYKGQACRGVVSGKGMDLSFQLSSGEGFAAPPLKDAVLKTFLSEEASLKLKPSFEIVSQLPELADNDDDAQQDASDQPAPTGPSAPAQPTSTQAPAEFTRRLGDLTPDIKRALAVDPPNAEEIRQYLEAVKELAKAAQFERGLKALEKLEQLVATALA